MTFNKYPMVMRHPAHQAAVYKRVSEAKGLLGGETVCLSAERFPDKTVHNENDQARYEALGYVPNGQSDEKQYEQQMLEGGASPESVGRAYPKWKYHKIEMPLIVQNKQEEDALKGDWFDRPQEATEEDLVAWQAQQLSQQDQRTDLVTEPPKKRGRKPREAQPA